MSIERIKKSSSYTYAGFVCSLVFIFWVLLSEYTSMFIGGDFGAFLYVTIHFIVNPLLGLSIAIFIIWPSLQQPKQKYLFLLSAIVPIAVTSIGLSGNLWLTDLLGISF